MIDRTPCALVLASLGLALAGGCQLLIGLPERAHTDEAADASGSQQPASDACEGYCRDVIDACAGGNDPFVDTADYASREVCLSVCPLLPAGSDLESDSTGNDVSCRRRNARLAKQLNRLEKASYCPAAGPGGGAPGAQPSCGSNCESYCSLYAQICDPELDRADCMRQCAGLRDTGVVNANRDFSDFPDTVQCRIAHLSVAAFTDPAAHCQHARLVPDEGEAAGCDLPPAEAPSCGDYCKLVGAACSGERALYESDTQCLRACAVLPSGAARETSGDSLACRRWRAYAALLDPATHCTNAGLLAAGPCGDTCQSYCGLLARTCQSEFSQHYPDNQACLSECARTPFERGYSLQNAGLRGSLQCRTLSLSRALAGNLQACESAAGEGECQ